MSGKVFKLHKEAVSKEFELVTAELMDFLLSAHFIERQVTFYFILKRFPAFIVTAVTVGMWSVGVLRSLCQLPRAVRLNSALLNRSGF